jgi:HSP20 family protein
MIVEGRNTDKQTGGASMAGNFGLMRWEPFRALPRLEEEIDRFLGRGSKWFEWPLYIWRLPFLAEGEYLPPLEIFERDGQTIVKLEMPGVEMEDIDISVADGVLTIKGEKKAEKETKEEDYYLSERVYGAFHRRISLPEGLDTNNISATHHNGVLEVVLPKLEEKTPHKVEVKAK